MTWVSPIWLVLVLGCDKAPQEEVPVITYPEGFPELRVPADNPLTTEKIALGRTLFYDVRLSGNETQSCGSCHEQELAFTDGRTVGEGSTGELHPRNANGLTNVGYNATLTWANPILTDIEGQILLPLFGEEPVELEAGPYRDEILVRLQDDPELLGQFQAAFPDDADPVTWERVIQGLASFSRSLISGNSPFDQFNYQGNAAALSSAQIRGLSLFYSEELECHHCHGGFNFSEASVHAGTVFDASLFLNTGLYNLDGEGAYPANNTGLYEITGDPADMGKFRAPSLRNVEVTGPYMHDGSMETLDEVLRFYERGGRLIESGDNAGDGALSPLKSGLVAGFELTDQERSDLVEFLEALTDEDFLTNPAYSDPNQDGSLQ